MSYQVIARKWRPQTFEEVTGQEAVTRTLRNAIEHERLHHAYLFSGARGVGKTTTARLLAKAVNCHRAERPTPTPCAFTDPQACASCREIAEGRSIDVLEIDAASNTGVDNVRDAIINTIGVRPARDRYKVFIIDEVHMLSGAAFNALLKTLEEPPPRVLFIMATTESHKVPETILSRCQQFEFRTIAAQKIVERLRLIADAEKIEVSDDALREIARAGEGSMRDAQSAFDQVISFSEGSIGTEDVEAALGIASAELRLRVMRAINETAPAEALAVVDDLVMRGHDLRNFCRDLLAHVRDLLVVKVAGDASALADLSDAERHELSSTAHGFSESDLVRFFHSLTETEKHLRESAHPRYQLEIGLVKLIEMRRLAPLGQIIERLNALEEAVRTGRAPAAGSSGASSPPTALPSTGGGGAAVPRRSSGASSSASADSTASASMPAPEPVTPPQVPQDSAGGEMVARREETKPPTRTFTPPPRLSELAAPPPSPQGASARPATKPNNGTAQNGAATGLKLVPPPAPTDGEADAPFPVRKSSGASPSNAAPQSFFDAPAPPPSAAPGDASSATATGSSAEGEPSTRAEAFAPLNDIGRIKKELDARRRPFLVAALEGVRRAGVEGGELYVEYAPEGKHLRDTLAKPENVRVLREVCREVLGRDVGVRIAVKEAGDADEGPSHKRDDAQVEQKRLREIAENHPAVQQVLKAFRGEIVDVRRIDQEP